jgi:hypothetical protein
MKHAHNSNQSSNKQRTGCHWSNVARTDKIKCHGIQESGNDRTMFAGDPET